MTAKLGAQRGVESLLEMNGAATGAARREVLLDGRAIHIIELTVHEEGHLL